MVAIDIGLRNQRLRSFQCTSSEDRGVSAGALAQARALLAPPDLRS